ncbi:FAD-dependent oxidoreductase [Desulfococcus multivorans]|uniref:FAD-dependent pyridine nucleotide-disulfide oxidoreductase n=1 Tax=Desulfococcus multivorans DSM 2059 TaxID=1121405 RepID=S7U2V5_DESML|nr:FAD-dependent oxidoreductase [Desulfococcus multivorans]AOY58515.1 coenzyme A disulfide reductase [Desulfococcus multivorans]AQV00829.1 pyridine nucleotide-disulfide oxidoreductase [Desulfococcus multivorans]EPR43300.1 FAD-dependent pyridine nucleotide-disulfide oxidoreductase [Desulfococcus multivorans DSM 2059]MDX9819261.1 FAD-dependent oxidoreductase [Desulfococcus multivorans]SJZ42319.1 NADPH-dependent 2,4-dienoyl-CoA reductase, sulfur reductase [Desulfococcus multivorans DSM 2059]
MSNLRVLIIGGVACGPKTASRLKRLCPDADITMIERDRLISYGACGLPYYVEGEFLNINALTHTQVGLPRTAEFFEKTKGFKVLARTEAIRINRSRKTVTVKALDTGVESDLPYDKLVIAAGGSAFRPPIPGIDLKNVWFMTHPEHARTLVEEIAAQGLKNAVMVGAGFIGMEMAEALMYKDMNVTMVEMFDHVLPGVMDRDLAAYVQLHLEDNDVDLALGERVVGLEGDGDGKVTAVKTDQRSISADCVVVAVGTRPNDELAREAGLFCDRGILINNNCQTSDPDIYAGGDCVLNRFINKTVAPPMYVPLGSTANKHGRTIANHIAGQQTPFPGINGTGVVKVFDYTVGRTGLTEAMAKKLGIAYESIVWGGPDRPHYMKNARYFLIKMLASKRDRKVLGVQVAGAGDGAKRLDVAAGTLYYGGTVEDLADIDLAYAPPFGPPIDPIAVCAHVLSNKMDGIARSISVYDAKERMDQGDVLLLDVREPDENKMLKMAYDKVVHIPLGSLRERLNELPRDKDIITFCKISLRGYEAQRILQAAGFDRVWFMEGGHEAWPFELDYLGM